MNLRDMAFKAFWTIANAGLAWAAVEITNADPPLVWGPVALAIIQFASTWVRQKVGATPPPAPVTPGPLSSLLN